MTNIEKELEHYKKLFSIGETDIAMKGYLTYVKFVKEQVEFMENFKIKENIGGKKAETVMYDRAMDIGNNLPAVISKMNALKNELKIEFQNETEIKRSATSPQSIIKREE